MKKVLAKGLALAFVGSLFMAGSAMALALDHGVKLLAVDGNDAGSSVTFFTADTIDAYALAYSVVDGVWNDLSAGSLVDFEGGTVFDLAVKDLSNTYYSLSGDVADDTYSVNLDFSGLVSGSFSQHPVMSTDYWNNLTTTWTFVNPVGSTNSIIFALSSVTDGVAPVPEPATMLLFGTGLAGLAGYTRKRRAQKK